jgi:hypothetical protein
MRQRTSAHVSIRQHILVTSVQHAHTSAQVSIRQHTSAYVSIRQHILVISVQHAQGFGKAEGGSGGRFLEYTDEASSFDGF